MNIKTASLPTEAESIRVAFVTGSLSRLNGGLFESVPSLGHALCQHGVSVQVFGLPDKYSKTDEVRWSPMPITELRPALTKRFGWYPRLHDALRRFTPHVIHQQSIWHPASYSIRRYAIETKTPIFVSARGMLDSWALQHHRWRKWIYWKLFERKFLNSITAFHALSQYEAESFRKLGLNVPVFVLPNGFRAPESCASHRDREDRRLLFIGRIHEKKGLMPLIDAWKQLSDASELNGWKLDIVGWDDGGHRQFLLQRVEQLGLGSTVQLHPAEYGQTKANRLRNSDAFVHTSYSEGLPMAILEAWAYGLPVIMTDACNLQIGFDANAAIRTDTDPSNIADAIRRIIAMTCKDRLEMGSNGRHLVQTSFDWREIASQMNRVYRWSAFGESKPDCFSRGILESREKNKIDSARSI